MSGQHSDKRFYVAGHRGLVGSAVCRAWQRRYPNSTSLIQRSSSELDLRDAAKVDAFFEEHRPEWVVLAAAKVGGIIANQTYPAEFILENLQIQNSVIAACHRWNVDKLIFLGSTCIYPKLAPQPMNEDCLLTSELEASNEPYAIAKIAGLITCQSFNRQYGSNFISLMPTNLYGPGDNFDLNNSHVLPAMLRKFHEAKLSGAKEVTLWGSGTPRREFLYVDDMAEAVMFALHELDASEGRSLYNVGVGEDLSIKELAELVQSVVGYQGNIVWDSSKPDGTPRKLVDVSKLQAKGFQASTPLKQGIEMSYRWFLAQESVRGGESL